MNKAARYEPPYVKELAAMTRTRKIGFTLLGALLAVGCIVVCLYVLLVLYVQGKIYGTGPFPNNTCSSDNPDNWIQDIAHFQLPPSARNLESSCFGLQGWIAYASFDMKPEDLDAFLATTYVLHLEPDTGEPENPAALALIEQNVPYLFGSDRRYEYYQEIFIDTSDPEWYRVYVYVLGG